MPFWSSPNVEQLQAKRNFEGLVKLLKHKDNNLRKQAAIALGELGDPYAVDELAASLKDPDAAVQESAITALIKIGAPAETVLINAAGSIYKLIQNRAIQYLVETKSQRAIESFIKMLNEEPLRERSALALEHIGPPAVESIVSAIKPGEYAHNIRLLNILEKMGDMSVFVPLLLEIEESSKVEAVLRRIGSPAPDHLIAALSHAKPEVQQKAIEALAQLGDTRALEPLTTLMLTNEGDTGAKALKALKDKFSVDVAAALMTALDSENSTTRKIAVSRLGALREERALERLIGMLDDPDLSLCEHTRATLVRSYWPTQLIPLLITSSSSIGRQEAARLLGGSGHASAVDRLIQLLHDGDPAVRASAAQSLGHIGDARSIDSLLAALNDPDSDVQLAAIESLGQIGDRRAAEPLASIGASRQDQVGERAAITVELLRRWEAENQQWASWLEKVMSQDPMAERVRAYQELRSSLYISQEQVGYGTPLAPYPACAPGSSEEYQYEERERKFYDGISSLPPKCHERAVTRLMADALGHPDMENRVKAVRALGNLKAKRAIPLLKELVLDWVHYESRSDNAMSRRGAAAYALAQIEDPDTIPFLVAALELKHLEIVPEHAQSLGTANIRMPSTDFGNQVMEKANSSERDEQLVRDLLTTACDETRADHFMPLYYVRSGGPEFERQCFALLIKQARKFLAAHQDSTQN